jgi:predicted DNA binding CopG/RHH family protein
MARTQPEKPEAPAESKYEPTDYERAVLAKQAQRLKDQVRAPRVKFVTDAISLRLPMTLLERIKVAANKRDVLYQSLIKTWLAEKMGTR